LTALQRGRREVERVTGACISTEVSNLKCFDLPGTRACDADKDQRVGQALCLSRCALRATFLYRWRERRRSHVIDPGRDAGPSNSDTPDLSYVKHAAVVIIQV
jgi:hypothetical protein